jgi:hypothetical protein
MNGDSGQDKLFWMLPMLLVMGARSLFCKAASPLGTALCPLSSAGDWTALDDDDDSPASAGSASRGRTHSSLGARNWQCWRAETVTSAMKFRRLLIHAAKRTGEGAIHERGHRQAAAKARTVQDRTTKKAKTGPYGPGKRTPWPPPPRCRDPEDHCSCNKD